MGAAGLAAWRAALEVAALDRLLVERFEGRRWEIPSKIYSDSLVVYPGAEEAPLTLVERLARLDYRAVEGDVAHAGEYRYKPGAASLDVHLRNFAYPDRLAGGFPVRVRFEEGKIAEVVRLDSGEAVDSFEIEPEVVAGIYQDVWEERRVVHLTEVPSMLVRAILAAEDRRFFAHHGLDVRGIARAALANLRSRRVVQGGSTLTQQLVKNLFLSGARTYKRKLTEGVLALLAEWHYSKPQILETYLNEIYLGQRGARGIFGVWEGARFYFGKEPKDLSVGEAAMLAGLIRSPGKLAPARNPVPAKARRDEVLRALFESGEVNEEELRAALPEPLPERLPLIEPAEGAYFVDFVRAELEAQYPLNALTSEGFRIFTTLDPRLQREAERAVTVGLAALEKQIPRLLKEKSGERVEAGLLALQPSSGEIKAMVGGRSYARSQFNRATQATRQPGSVFKPIVFLAAFEEEEQEGGGRFVPTRRLLDEPFTWSYDGREWSPANYKGEYHGEVTVRQALERSLNSATARLAQEVGLRRVRDMAVRLGFAPDLPAVPSLVLGSVEVTPLEVAQAFATIANLGFRTEEASIRAVLDGEGNPIARSSLRASQTVSPRVAYLVTHLMEGVLDRGTARSARSAGFNLPAAGKTGTTNDGRDAWFVGFTPDLLTVVWVGFDHATLGLSGAQAALPIWTDFMKAATAGHAPTPFLVPPGIQILTVDPASGRLATPGCPTSVDEAFLSGEAPTEPCAMHGGALQSVPPPEVPILEPQAARSLGGR